MYVQRMGGRGKTGQREAWKKIESNSQWWRLRQSKKKGNSKKREREKKKEPNRMWEKRLKRESFS